MYSVMDKRQSCFADFRQIKMTILSNSKDETDEKGGRDGWTDETDGRDRRMDGQD
jgi:hypothetical protein